MKQQLKNVKSNGGNLTMFGFTYTAVNDGPKLGRNDECHCGSGKKYKKCCLEKDEMDAAAFDAQRFIGTKVREMKESHEQLNAKLKDMHECGSTSDCEECVEFKKCMQSC